MERRSFGTARRIPIFHDRATLDVATGRARLIARTECLVQVASIESKHTDGRGHRQRAVTFTSAADDNVARCGWKG